MTKIERVYNVPLRKEYMKAPRHKRTPKAVRAIRQFMIRHMKSENISLGTHLNELMWRDGIKNPPHHVKVNAVKDENGKVTVELVGVQMPVAKPKEVKSTKTGLAKKIEEKLASGPKKKKSEKEAEKANEKPAETKIEKAVKKEEKKTVPTPSAPVETVKKETESTPQKEEKVVSSEEKRATPKEQ